MKKNNYKRKNHYKMVVSLETVNGLHCPLVHNIDFAVTDKHGITHEKRSYMVSEMFVSHAEIMERASYADKFPQYWVDYLEGKRNLTKIAIIRHEVRKAMKKYNIRDVYTYNINLNVTGLNYTLCFLLDSKRKKFFPYGTRFHHT